MVAFDKAFFLGEVGSLALMIGHPPRFCAAPLASMTKRIVVSGAAKVKKAKGCKDKGLRSEPLDRHMGLPPAGGGSTRP